MSQNDMSVANGDGGTVRADLNSALQALASANSGAAAPSTTYAYQVWGDTANDLIKIRDEANTTWAIWASLSGSTFIPYRDGVAIGTMAILTYAAINQDLVMSGKRVKFASGTLVAATTTDLATLAGNKGVITGNTTIAGFGTTQAGEIFFLTFTGTPQITHNATTNIVAGGASLTMAAGNFAIVMSEGGGNNRIFVFKADGSAVVGATSVATQSDQEMATSTTAYVTPGRQHFHPSALKSWATISMAAALLAGYNVASVVDNGTGNFTVNWTTAFSAATYPAVPGIHGTNGRACKCSAKAVGSVTLDVTDFSNSNQETGVTSAMVICAGDQ